MLGIGVTPTPYTAMFQQAERFTKQSRLDEFSDRSPFPQPPGTRSRAGSRRSGPGGHGKNLAGGRSGQFVFSLLSKIDQLLVEAWVRFFECDRIHQPPAQFLPGLLILLLGEQRFA